MGSRAAPAKGLSCMARKMPVPDAETSARRLREQQSKAVADEFERLIAEGKNIQDMRRLRSYGIKPNG